MAWRHSVLLTLQAACFKDSVRTCGSHLGLVVSWQLWDIPAHVGRPVQRAVKWSLLTTITQPKPDGNVTAVPEVCETRE